MTPLAPTLQAFFTERLARQRSASPHTIAAYRDTWRLLLGFASRQERRQPSQLSLTDLDAPLIGAFLDHLEHQRGNSPRTRNARLAAIRSLFRYAALRHPEHAEVIARVLAIPPKRFDRTLVTYLTEPEVRALLTAPDTSTRTGRRDHALLALAAQTGLRVSELTSLTCGDVHLGTGAHVSCTGKGRKQRITPLTPGTVTVLRTWLAERGSQPDQPLFPARTGGHLSRDAVERRLAIHAATAAASTPSLTSKTITAHTLRRTAAMRLLHAGTDTSVSVTNRPKPPRSTCTPTSPSKNEHSPAPPRPPLNPAATHHPTNSSRSSKPSDYADLHAARTGTTSDPSHQIGIIPRSA